MSYPDWFFKITDGWEMAMKPRICCSSRTLPFNARRDRRSDSCRRSTAGRVAISAGGEETPSALVGQDGAQDFKHLFAVLAQL